MGQKIPFGLYRLIHGQHHRHISVASPGLVPDRGHGIQPLCFAVLLAHRCNILSCQQLGLQLSEAIVCIGLKLSQRQRTRALIRIIYVIEAVLGRLYAADVQDTVVFLYFQQPAFHLPVGFVLFTGGQVAVNALCRHLRRGSAGEILCRPCHLIFQILTVCAVADAYRRRADDHGDQYHIGGGFPSQRSAYSVSFRHAVPSIPFFPCSP